MTEEEIVKQREYKTNWYRTNKEKACEAARKRYAANIEKQRERGREKYHANKEKYADNRRKRLGIVDSGRRRGVVMSPEVKYARSRKTIRHDYLKKKYGISLEEFNQMVEKQNGRCAICGKHHSEHFMQSLCVDHDHKTGKVRGLLCRNCNAGLGNLRDNVEILQKAIVYLSA